MERDSVSFEIDHDFKKKNGLVNVQKSFRKNILKLLTAIKLKIFKRRSITTLRYKPMGDKGCLSCVDK